MCSKFTIDTASIKIKYKLKKNYFELAYDGQFWPRQLWEFS